MQHSLISASHDAPGIAWMPPGDYLIMGRNWKGPVPSGMQQISAPNNSVIVVGRVLAKSDGDLPAACDLSKQIQLTPLSGRQPA